MKYKHLKKIILSAIVASGFYLFCVAPIDPYSDLQTASQLLLKNSSGQFDTLSIEDSVGKPISIGICRYLPKNIDSVKLTITSTTSTAVLDTVIHFFITPKTYDTLWKQITFKSSGYFLVKANAFTLLKTILSDSVTIIIHDRSIPNNSPPKWDTDTIKMSAFSGANISIILADTCSDPDNDQLSFSLLSELPAKDTIINNIYRFTPLVVDTGTYAIHIVAADPSQATDTLTIALNIRPASIDSIKPTYKLVRPNKDSISVNATSFKIDIVFTDAGNIASVKCFKGADSFNVEHTDSLYSAIVTGLQANVYNAITFVAVDGSSRANETRKTIYIKNDPQLQDLAGPIMRRSLPSRDSIVTAVDSVAISIVATDQSGVASVAALLGTTIMSVKKADSVYSTVIKGLSSIATNRVYFIATDSSANKNADTLTFFIKYDPTTNDHQKPTMSRKTPAPDSVTVNSSSTTIAIIAKDANDIASVACSFGTATPTVTANDSIYSVTVTGLVANQFNKIRFIATDASSNGNKETLFVTVKYVPAIVENQPPTMSLKTPASDSAIVNSGSATVAIIAKDASGIASVVCSFGSTAQAVTAADSIYSATVTGLVANQFNPIRFIATDGSSNGNKETLFVTVKYIPAIVDTKKPTLKRKTPATDSASVSSASASISVLAKDSSGIASVVCSMGDSTFAVTAADSIYSATVNGLIASQFNKIRFIATDASSSGNKETLFVTLKYDPTLADNVPPIFTKVTGPESGTTVTTAAIAYDYSITDIGSGVDSVYWTLNGTRQGYLSIVMADRYSLSGSLTAPPTANRIVIIAWDKSANHNRDSVVIALTYTPPCLVSFNSQGGSTVASQTVNYGAHATAPAAPTLAGSAFAGWFKEAACTNPWVFAAEAVTGPVTLYAKWTLIPTYTVTYFGNGNTGGTVPNDANTYLQSATVTVLGNTGSLVRAGYTFTGWNTMANGTGTGYSATQTFAMGTVNVSLYAQWTLIPTYTVTYFGNGNTGGTVPNDANTYLQSATVTVLGNTGSLVRAGYTFTGWNTMANGTGTGYSATQTFAMGTVNVSLYAQWTLIPTYTVTYFGNGNTGGTVPNDANTYLQSATVTVLGNTGSLVRAGYTFAGWNTMANGTGTGYSATQTFAMGTANVSLYANWTYNGCMDGDGNIYTTVTIGGKTWAVGNLKTTKYNDGSPIPPAQDDITWGALTGPGFCWYNGDVSNRDIYGGLYNWYAVNTGKLAPTGWHVATDADWHSIIAAYDSISAGGKLKETGTTHWQSPNTGATNETGFTALPGGYRVNSGYFSNITVIAMWWTSTVAYSGMAWYRSIVNNTAALWQDHIIVGCGLSVRLVKDP